MKDLISKELRQKWPFLISAFFMGIMPYLYFFFSTWRYCGESNNRYFRQTDIIVFLVVAGFIQMMTLKSDKRKSIDDFTASKSGDFRSFFLIKYVLILSMVILFYLGYTAPLIIAGAGVRGVFSLSRFAVFVLCLQIFVRAIDIPLVYRFGLIKVNTVKIICLILLTLLSFIMLDDVHQTLGRSFFVFNQRFFASLWPVLIICSLVIYYLSYRITCSFYPEGAEHYEK